MENKRWGFTPAGTLVQAIDGVVVSRRHRRKNQLIPTKPFALLLGIRCAPATNMIDVALSILALIAGGLTLELFAATWPPLGHAEERGYKYPGKALKTVEELQIGNPS
jgi:hypothetical protein